MHLPLPHWCVTDNVLVVVDIHVSLAYLWKFTYVEKECCPHTPDELSMPQTHDGSVTSMHLSQNGDDQDAPVESHTVILIDKGESIDAPNITWQFALDTS